MKSKKLITNNISNCILPTILVIILILLIIILYKIKDNFNNKENDDKKRKRKARLTGAWVWDAKAIGMDFFSFNPCDIGIFFGVNLTDANTIINSIINDVAGLKNARQKFLGLGIGQTMNTISLEWKKTDFASIINQIPNIKSKGWTGICFNINSCTNNVPFVDDFANCFAKCKEGGLKVLVTMSQTVPPKCQSGAGQGMDLIKSWVKSSHIDYISPQLFQPGANEKVLVPTNLSILKKAKAKIIPSIPYDTNWPQIQNLGIEPYGYITWLQPPQGICGTSPQNAMDNYNKNIAVTCTSDAQCASGQKCFM
jgi:hypothetical protein